MMTTNQVSGVRGQVSGWPAVTGAFVAGIVILFAAVVSVAADTNALALAGDQVTAGRLTIQVGSNGLPAQISIAAAPEELPLEHRKADAPPMSGQDLLARGRGPQLKTAMRVEAMAGGNAVTLAPVEPAAPAVNGERVTSTAKLAGGGVNATVESTVGRDGAVSIRITYGGGATVDSLALVMELEGPVDTVVAGGAPYAVANYSLGADEGLLWGNAAPAAGASATTANRGAPGVVPHLFWGSGDRGWTWLAEGDGGWTVAPGAATMTLTRDKTGTVIWRALLVNQPTRLTGDKTVAFTLLTHPAATRAAGFRRALWLDWPFADAAAKTPPLTVAGRAGVSGLVRADAGSLCEATAGALWLEGPAGGAAASATHSIADTFSPGLFRYLAGTHLGVGGRLLANSPKLVQPSQSPACDRMAVARALMHDLGVDPAGVSQLAMLSRLVTALNEFGYFAADGQTEYIPYWRSGALVRYGEVFSGKDPFAETLTDPLERVKVSVWRRPAAGGTGYSVMILIVNEGDKAMREQFYVLDGAALYGAAAGNQVSYADSTRRWDLSSIPSNSDWAGIASANLPAAPGGVKLQRGWLRDMEDQGGVGCVNSSKGAGARQEEVYDRTFIPAKGFRLFLGGVALAAKKP